MVGVKRTVKVEEKPVNSHGQTVAMASVQAQMLSGWYRSESLCINWSKNKGGFCLLSPSCEGLEEDIPHILSSSVGMAPIRKKLVSFTLEYCRRVPLASL